MAASLRTFTLLRKKSWALGFQWKMDQTRTKVAWSIHSGKVRLPSCSKWQCIQECPNRVRFLNALPFRTTGGSSKLSEISPPANVHYHMQQIGSEAPAIPIQTLVHQLGHEGRSVDQRKFRSQTSDSMERFSKQRWEESEKKRRVEDLNSTLPETNIAPENPHLSW